jgi:hypothetical protein
MLGTLVRMGFRVWVFSKVVKWIKGHEGLARIPSSRRQKAQAS